MIKGLETQGEGITEMMLVGQKEEKAVGDLTAVLLYIICLVKELGSRCCSPMKMVQDRMGELWL